MVTTRRCSALGLHSQEDTQKEEEEQKIEKNLEKKKRYSRKMYGDDDDEANVYSIWMMRAQWSCT